MKMSVEKGSGMTPPQSGAELAVIIAEMRNVSRICGMVEPLHEYAMTITDWAVRLAALSSHRQVTEDKEVTTRVDDTQYPSKPLATAASNEPGPHRVKPPRNFNPPLPRIQIVNRQHPHFEEYGRFTGKVIVMPLGEKMAEVTLENCCHGTGGCFVSVGDVRAVPER